MELMQLIYKTVLLFGKDKVLAHCSIYILPIGNSLKATGVESATVFCEQSNDSNEASSKILKSIGMDFFQL